MKKLLRRRRGNTSNSDGGGVGPLSPTSIQSFVIVGGQGGIAAGTTVYDTDQIHSISPPLSHSPVTIAMNSPQSPISPISPKSPTFSQSMLIRFTGREHRTPPIQISAPIMISSRGRPRFPSAADIFVENPHMLSNTSVRKKSNRRSLSADSHYALNGQRSGLAPNNASDTAINIVSVEHHQNNQQSIFETDKEFYNKSLEFLKMHHSRSNTADDWANRNKRKTSIPRRRQSESSLLTKIAEANNESTANISDNEDNDIIPLKQDDLNPFGPGSCWKDIDYSCSEEYDLDEEYRSLLSSVDIMLVPCISSPTRFYSCPKSRKVVQTYLTSGEREFDEMLEHGFPASSVIEDKNGKVKDCRFMTLRLTLTPWHARANESKLYGSGDAEKSAPPKGMVNKFLSKTTARMSSPSLLPEGKLPNLRGRKSPAPEIIPTRGAAQVNVSQGIHPLDENAAVTPISIDTYEAQTIQRGDIQTTGVFPPKPQYKSKTGALRREKGFRIMDPTTPPLAPHVIRNRSSTEMLNRDAEFYTSPPSTPSPTSLSPNQYQIHPYGYSQHQNQPPRKGSLSALSMPMNTYFASNSYSSEEKLLTPPIVPPRRKVSSPAIFSNETHTNSLPLSPPDSQLRPRSTTPLATSSTNLHQTSTQSRKAFSSRPTTSPIPIPNSSRCQQQHQTVPYQQYAVSSTDSDILKAPIARTPRAPLRKGSDQFESISTRTMSIATPRQDYDTNTMITTSIIQDCNQAVSSQSQTYNEMHKGYTPRTQYTPPVSTH
ncbi:hypothetical protein BGZ76_006703 [Entomortierella beljakovae]|nr:hypothetical protein BGZ76_006703 [Entomortierella beljakovae]